MYQFQVLALNHNEEGNASLTVLGETRYGTIGQVAASVAAGVGGTIGEPIVGVTGFGVLAAESAKSIPDSETGKTAASVAPPATPPPMPAATEAAVGGCLQHHVSEFQQESWSTRK